MHSLKVTWSGRTFALAKPNDSGGKKSRNRIPKEERKALMESFIKKHQRLNKGNFPSLSLTHKEVGGSFYTIREIFREIIQENRVLGPADLEQIQSETSSISMEPVPPLSLSPNGNPSALDHRHCSKETLVLVSDTRSLEADAVKVLGNDDSVNESHESSKGRESNTVDISEPLPAACSEKTVLEDDVGIHEGDEILNGCVSDEPEEREQENGINIENEELGEIIGGELEDMKPVEVDKTVTESVVVETFPLKDSCNGQSSEFESSCDDGKGIKIVEKETEAIVDRRLASKDYDPSLEKKTQEHSETSKEMATKLDGMSSVIRHEVADAKETTMEEDKADAPDSSGSEKGSTPILNRIKPESWEGVSNNMGRRETNPLLAVFKSFLTAFVKFWSE